MDLNLNRIFPFGIRTKLAVAFLALSSVPLLFSGIYAIHVHTQALQERELEHLGHDVSTVCERTSTFLKGVESDIRFLGESHLFRRFSERLDDREAADAFVRQVLDFARSKGIYYQIRLLDEDGQEAVKVRMEAGGYAVLPADPQAAGQYYLHLVEDLRRGEFTSSPVELTDSRGGFVSAVSYVLPVFDAEERLAGMLVADVFARDLFRIVAEAHDNVGGKVMLVSSEGFYLYHSEKKTNWRQLLAAREENNVFRDYAPQIAAQIMAGKPGVTITDEDVIAYASLLPDVAEKMGIYTLFMSVPREEILAPVASFKWTFYGLLALFVVLSVGLAYLAAAQFTRPINALQREAQVIAEGAFGHRLRVETYDEIQQLAETFNTMAQAVQERETEIRQHEAELAAAVALRTRELAEEKGKLQAILDSVPSAFVVLDRNLHILSASKAFERISGHAPETVIGQPYGRFFPDCRGDGERRCPAEEALRQERLVADVQSLRISDQGASRHIERIAIPVLRDEGIEQVIEVVTDVTERKEMETRVIHSEKLATTGEMAAVIAHEMRNSLTSVKMILQLELEREELMAADREALEVAAHSVLRMETVVTELLKFARPSPLEFKPQLVDAILRDSIALIEPQIRRKAVNLKETFAARLPAVQGDADQLKEVFVNLLLNAAQAIAAEGEIAVLTRPCVEEGEVEIAVEDTGPGFPEGLEQRIFDPFFTSKQDGTGLGLSMARRTVEAHGGKISAANRQEGGARFTVWLPVDGNGLFQKEA